MENLSIDFYEDSKAAVTISWPPGTSQATDPQIGAATDALLFACYSLRQLRNLGNHPSASALAQALMTWSPPITSEFANQTVDSAPIVAHPTHVLRDAAINMGLTTEAADKKYGKPIYLVPNQGNGKKRFLARLRATSDRPVFWLKTKGFGLGGILGFGITQPATDSVMILLAHLAQSYRDDESYLKGVQNVAYECAREHRAGKITSMNQEPLALQIVQEFIP